MNFQQDNPLKRFSLFWRGLGLFLLVPVVLLFIWMWKRQPAEGLEDAAAKVRYETKSKLDAAQREALSPEAVEAAITEVAAGLAASRPVAVERPDQVVPGSATSVRLSEQPAPDTSVVDSAPVADVPLDPAVMELGKAQFMVCAACHGQNGEGGPVAPPLAGSEWVTGPVSNLIRIQLRGLEGPITVAGKEYNFPVGMAPMAYQTDEQIAAVLTYVRNSLGNKAPAVTPDQVEALRGEVGKPMLKAADLVKP